MAGAEQIVDLSDEVTLLQAEAVTKTQQRTAVAAATAKSAEAEEAVVKADPFCEATLAAADASPISAASEKAEVAADVATTEGQQPILADEKVDAQAPPSRSALAGVLEVLIVLIVLDGFRRWQIAQKEEKKAGQKQKHTGKAAKESIESGGGWEALMQAALAGDSLHAQKALRGVSFTKLSHADVWGCTVLHAAAKGGSSEVMQMLLERGANVHERDAWDETPLHLAARAGNTAACDTLLAFGADVDALNAQDWTPLVVAGDAGHKVLCSMLLGRGAGVAGLPHADLPFLLRGLLSRDDDEEEDERADFSEEVFCY